jgi:hypothetical protein
MLAILEGLRYTRHVYSTEMRDRRTVSRTALKKERGVN